MNKILIVKTSALGDIIHAFAVASYLKMRFPEASLHWAAEKACADLVKAHPLIDQVIETDTKTWRKHPFSFSTWKTLFHLRKKLKKAGYDLVIDLQGNTKSAIITGSAKAKERVGFDRRSVSEILNLLVTNRRYNVLSGISIQKRYLSLVQQYFEDVLPFEPAPISLVLNADETKKLSDWRASSLSHSFKVMVCFGSKWPNKRLSKDTLIAFLKQMEAQFSPEFCFIWGNTEEKLIAENLHSEFAHSKPLGNLSLPLWQHTMMHMDLIIAMDSAALHLCALTKTPTFSVFGPSLSSVYKPIGESHGSFQGSCPYNQTFDARCPVLRNCKTGSCMKDIDPKRLYDCFNRFWSALPQNLEIGSI